MCLRSLQGWARDSVQLRSVTPQLHWMELFKLSFESFRKQMQMWWRAKGIVRLF